MKLLVVYLLVLMGVDATGPNHEDYFDAVFHNKVVGELKTSKVIKDSQTIYSNYTLIEAHLLKSVTISNDSEVIFEEDFLSEADATILVNKKIREQTKTNWIGSKYRVQTFNQEEIYISNPILFSVVRLLFEEPKNVDRVFSEASGEFHTIEAIGDHVYQKINPKGHHNRYYYSNGALDKAVVDEGIIKYELKRRVKND